MKLLAIDGNSILNRAFYGIKALTNKNREYTNGIYGFMTILPVSYTHLVDVKLLYKVADYQVSENH